MSSIRADVHVIDKADIAQHRVVSLTTTLPALRDGCVRMRSLVISLSNNNLSYAQMGTIRNWWEAYPVPSDLQAPYNDQSAYGIVPAWGFAEVLESKVPGLKPGMLMWGFWSTASLPIDLQLELAPQVADQWIEVSSARKNLMNVYNRYFLSDPNKRFDPASEADVDDMGWKAATRTVSGSGYIINKCIFGSPPIHPLGIGEWTQEDADLSSAVVVSLSASGKTARGYNEAVVNRRAKGTGPLGFLAVTSKVLDSLVPPAAFPTKVVSYDDMATEDTMRWVQQLQPRKVAIVDFGGRGDSIVRLTEALRASLPGAKVVVIGVGGNHNLRTGKDISQHLQREIPFDRIQMNLSGIKDRLLEMEGAEALAKETEEAWEGLKTSGVLQDLKLVVGKGIGGIDGIEGGWEKMLKSEVPADVALAYVV